jgi:hypothetical protein
VFFIVGEIGTREYNIGTERELVTEVTKGEGVNGKRKEGFFLKALFESTEDILNRGILSIDSNLILNSFPRRSHSQQIGAVGDAAAISVFVVPERGVVPGKMTNHLAVGGEDVGGKKR